MVELHFARHTDEAKTQHVRARSWDNLRQYLQVVYELGEGVGYERDEMFQQYKQFTGGSRTAAEETHSLLKKFGLLDRSNSPTVAGEFAGELISRSRLDLATEVFLQHFRAMPTIAYTIDIVRNSSDPVTPEEIHTLMNQYNTTDSTSQANSIVNALNLLEEFGLVNEQDDSYTSTIRDQIPVEALPYGLYLLSELQNPIEAEIMRTRLPLLTHSSGERCEQLMETARRRYTLFDFRTGGDPSRTSPFGGVFEVVRIEEIDAKNLQKSLL